METTKVSNKTRWLLPILAFAVVVLLADVVVWFWGMEKITNLTNTHKAKLKVEVDRFNKQIDSHVEVAIDDITRKLAEESDAIVTESLSGYQSKLDKLEEQIEISRHELEEIVESKGRAKKGLPELVELSDLRNYYAEKLKGKSEYSYKTIESFETPKGQISFTAADLDFEFVPSTNALAWLRIGKNDSTLNSELIKSWIISSREVKKKLGYEEIYKKTKPSDYGEYTEVLLRKGDMYFKTYYQHQRVSGTYGRHSLKYTFYVETGSESLKEKAMMEKYNKSLGS